MGRDRAGRGRAGQDRVQTSLSPNISKAVKSYSKPRPSMQLSASAPAAMTDFQLRLGNKSLADCSTKKGICVKIGSIKLLPHGMQVRMRQVRMEKRRSTRSRQC